MSKVDLSDIYDSCYSGYDDYTAELRLERDMGSGEWRGDSIKFYKTESYGWAYEKTADGWNYGYDTLEEAVTKYTGGLASRSAEGKYIASRRLSKQYVYKLNPKTSQGYIHCTVIERMFKGKCDRTRMDYINDGISTAFSKFAS